MKLGQMCAAAAGVASLAASAATAAPILSGVSIAIPEPSDLGLFLIGVAGLLIGRRAARRLHKDDGDTKA